MKFWGVIEDGSGKFKLTDLGRLIAKDKGAHRSEALRRVVVSIPAYFAILERSLHKKENSYSATDVATHWHQHFRDDSSDSEKILNDQAVCFFQIAEGADLGRLIVGRKGQPTRFEFDNSNVAALVEGSPVLPTEKVEQDHSIDLDDGDAGGISINPSLNGASALGRAPQNGNRVFITHGKNKKILDQVKDIVIYGGFEPIVAVERESGAKPVPEKVMADMRTCAAAVIHVAVDEVLFDKDGNGRPQINGNVLIEIGAAMALYPGYKFILLVEEGLKLPSNLQGLYECRYTGDELSGGATMKLLKSFNEFKSAA